jgi:hypothetical protein
LSQWWWWPVGTAECIEGYEIHRYNPVYNFSVWINSVINLWYALFCLWYISSTVCSSVRSCILCNCLVASQRYWYMEYFILWNKSKWYVDNS